MKDFHSLLRRQLKKSKVTTEFTQENLDAFLELVNGSYFAADEDRYLLEHSLELTSNELVERYKHKEIENDQLVEAQCLLVEKEKKLEATIREKDVLMQEIHHRVKNNLAVISGMLYLQKETERNDYVRLKLHEAQSRIQSMAMIHKMLYSSNSFSHIEISAYIKELVKTLVDNFKARELELETTYDIEKIVLDIETAIPIALLTNEIITNSLKYAFPKCDKGKLHIGFKLIENDTLVFTISDDGVGIKNEVKDPNSASLGFMLIQSFVQQIEGTLEQTADNGTSYIISFPASEFITKLTEQAELVA